MTIDPVLVPVSRKRRFLAWYIDVLFMMVVLGLAEFCLQGYRIPFVVKSILLVGIIFVLDRTASSAGFRFLGISRAFNSEGRPCLTVDPSVKNNEHWATVLFGLLFILDGTKSLVRWAEGMPILPVLGVQPDYFQTAIYSILFGVYALFTGYCIFQLKRIAVWLILAGALFSAVSLVMSWELLPEAIANIQRIRRAIQGVPVRPDEIGFMQSTVKQLLIGSLAFSVLFTGLFHKRFTR